MRYKFFYALMASLCGCSFNPASQKALYSTYFDKGHENVKVTEIEAELKLGAPVEVRTPILNDPSWWFIYNAGGCTIEIAANVETDHTVNEAKADRSGFYFAELSWVMDKSDTRPRRYDAKGSPSLTTNIGSRGASKDTAEGRYLSSLDISNPPSIMTLQKHLGLGKPVNVEVPAFIRPEWYIFYNAGDKVITLTGTLDTAQKESHDPKDTQQYLFTGYWSVEHNDDQHANAKPGSDQH